MRKLFPVAGMDGSTIGPAPTEAGMIALVPMFADAVTIFCPRIQDSAAGSLVLDMYRVHHYRFGPTAGMDGGK